MAVATVTNPCYGYHVTGDTDITTVTTKRIRIKSFIFKNHAASETATISDNAGTVMIIVPDTTIAGVQTQIFWDAYLDGLRVTLSNGAAILDVIVA